MADRSPNYAKRFAATDDGIKAMFRHLETFHGISQVVAGERLHAIKQHFGYSGDDNLIFDRTGNSYDPVTFSFSHH